MKTVLKSLVVGLIVFIFSFSPSLAALAKADGFNFEGISSIKTDDTQSFDKQPRGLMFNFSFGGPKGYKKKTKSQKVAMFEDSTEFWSVVGFVAVVAFIYFTVSDSDSDTLLVPPDDNPSDTDSDTDMPPENDMPPGN